jgi:hypothetical protein
MKKKAILMVLLIALFIGSIMSIPLIHAARADARTEGPQPQASDYQKKWAKDFTFASGQAFNSPTWPGQGILYSSGYPADSYAYYSFTLLAPPWDISSLDVGVYGKALSGNGLDVHVWNWASSSWDYVGTTGTGEGLYTWGVNPTNHVQGSSYEYRLRVYADDYFAFPFVNDDRYDMWYIDTYYTYTPTTKDTVLDFKFTPNPVKTGTTCTLSGTLKTVVGSNPVYPAQVTVEYSTDGGTTWNYAWTLSTNAAGQFGTTFTAPGAGTYLVRVRYAGSATYNPSSHTETLTITALPWGDYHFRINPWIDMMHLKISGSVVYGVHEIPGMYSETPLLGYIEGSTFYIFIDYPDGVYSQEMMMLVGSTSTLSGNAYQTQNGKSWTYAASFSLTSVSAASGSSATDSSLASAVEPEAWPPTYHFRLSPWIDIVRLGVDGSVIHGTDEAAGFYVDQPVLGSISGSFFMLGIDWTKAGLTYEFGIIRASTSTMSGYAYRTTNGKSFSSGPTISFVSVPP